MRKSVNKFSEKISKLPREKLEEIVEKTFEQNENFYEIIDSLSTGLLIVDNTCCIQEYNQIVEAILPLHIRLREAKKTGLPVWEIINDEDISKFLKSVFDKQLTNSSDEFSTVTPGGSVRFLNITINPLMIKNQLSGKIILVTDITEKKGQEVLVHRMENMANLTTLAAGMAHEIKNPLAAISIHMQLLEKALEKARSNDNILPPQKFVEDHVLVVNEEVDHLNKLVMDFLFAVRPVNATLQLKDPASLIINIVNFFEAEFRSYGIKVIIKEPADSVRIMMDEKLFRDIIINLAQNSLAAIKSNHAECNEQKFADVDEADFPGTFEITSVIKDNKYEIYVTDNGCGMSSESVAKIFEPYYTTKANGTGLGMTMVYKIIKEFSGDIQVQSEIGKGTTFKMSFPIPQQNKKLLKSN